MQRAASLREGLSLGVCVPDVLHRHSTKAVEEKTDKKESCPEGPPKRLGEAWGGGGFAENTVRL